MTASRRVPKRTVSLALVVSVLTTVAALAFSSGPALGAHSPTHATASTATEAAFAAEMRRLWFEHVQWTRLAIVSFAAGLPDLQPTLARLLRNQRDIGAAIAPYYGARAGKQLTTLLRAAHPRRRGRVEGCEGRQRERTRARSAALERERRLDRGFSLLGEPTELAEAGAPQHASRAPRSDDEGGRRASRRPLGGRRQGGRRSRAADAAHGRRSLSRDRRSIPAAVRPELRGGLTAHTYRCSSRQTRQIAQPQASRTTKNTIASAPLGDRPISAAMSRTASRIAA